MKDIQSDVRFGHKDMPKPNHDDPMFDAIWNVIKSWDIAVPEYYSGYTGAMGNHVQLILDAINAHQKPMV
jgi:hypothetical protein